MKFRIEKDLLWSSKYIKIKKTIYNTGRIGVHERQKRWTANSLISAIRLNKTVNPSVIGVCDGATNKYKYIKSVNNS